MICSVKATYKLQLLDQIVQGFGLGTDDAMFAAGKAEQCRQIQVAEAMDL